MGRRRLPTALGLSIAGKVRTSTEGLKGEASAVVGTTSRTTSEAKGARRRRQEGPRTPSRENSAGTKGVGLATAGSALAASRGRHESEIKALGIGTSVGRLVGQVAGLSKGPCTATTGSKEGRSTATGQGVSGPTSTTLARGRLSKVGKAEVCVAAGTSEVSATGAIAAKVEAAKGSEGRAASKGPRRSQGEVEEGATGFKEDEAFDLGT